MNLACATYSIYGGHVEIWYVYYQIEIFHRLLFYECVAVLIGLYKHNGTVSWAVEDFSVAHNKKAVVTPGYPVGLDLTVGRYQ